MKANAESAIVAGVRNDESIICSTNRARWIAAKMAKKIDLVSRKNPLEETFGRRRYRIIIRYGRLSKRRADGIKERILSSKSGVKSKPVGVTGPNDSKLDRVTDREEPFDKATQGPIPDMLKNLYGRRSPRENGKNNK
jgi:hypothetical protein